MPLNEKDRLDLATGLSVFALITFLKDGSLIIGSIYFYKLDRVVSGEQLKWSTPVAEDQARRLAEAFNC